MTAEAVITMKATPQSVFSVLKSRVTAGMRITISSPTNMLRKSIKAKSKLEFVMLETVLKTISITIGMTTLRAIGPRSN